MSLPPSYNLLAKYPNRVYIETGIFRGDSIQFAIDAGFEKVIGIEVFKEWVDFVSSRFPAQIYPGRINLVHGDSADCLWEVIRHINEPMTIYLDSHSQLLEDEPEIKNPFPLLKELEQIARHPIKTHTLIIDDYLYLTHQKVTGWVNGEIEAAIMKINPAYKIEYIANPVIGNLIVATV